MKFTMKWEMIKLHWQLNNFDWLLKKFGIGSTQQKSGTSDWVEQIVSPIL